MLDSLDLGLIKSYLISTKKASRIARTLSIVAIFLLVSPIALVILLSDSKSDPKSCTCSPILDLFCLGIPIGIILGLATLTYGNRAKERSKRILNPDLVDLSSIALPEPIIMLTSKGNILSIAFIGIWVFIASLFDINVGVAIFVMVALPLTFSILLGLWLRKPLRAGHYDETKRRSKILQEWFRGDRLILNLEGLALLFSGDSSESEKVHRQLIAQSIKYPNLKIRGLAFSNFANELMYQGRYGEAQTLLETAIYLQPDFAGAYNSLAEWYLVQNMSPERALELINFGLQLSPSNKKTGTFHLKMANRAWAEARLGLGETAKTALAQAFKYSDSRNVPAYAELNRIAGETYLALGDIEKARDHFLKAAEIDPNGRIGKLAQAALERLASDKQ